MSNATLSTLQQIITIIMALTGAIVAWRPPKKETLQEYIIIGSFVGLGLLGVALTWVQGHRLDVASAKQVRQLDAIEKNTGQSGPRAIIRSEPYPPFLRKDGLVQVNSLITNRGTIPSAPDTVWVGKLWVLWDSEVPKEPGPQGELEDRLWKELEAEPQNSYVKGSVSLGTPEFRRITGDTAMSEEDYSGITHGQKLVYVMSITRYPENHETDFCGFFWSDNKGLYQGCKDHNGSH